LPPPSGGRSRTQQRQQRQQGGFHLYYSVGSHAKRRVQQSVRPHEPFRFGSLKHRALSPRVSPPRPLSACGGLKPASPQTTPSEAYSRSHILTLPHTHTLTLSRRPHLIRGHSRGRSHTKDRQTSNLLRPPACPPQCRHPSPPYFGQTIAQLATSVLASQIPLHTGSRHRILDPA
jgi:hypothetical protein